ncbi:hypothetical protein AX17_001814 [Amanita inopinata Kibby_2008]|nr:hypothetical protein AX17_001814 [Amanita inopinata Kibby_2008]
MSSDNVWSFRLRESIDEDDSYDEPEPPVSSIPRERQLLNDLDLASREETVNYKPNPFSIAKINAATRSVASSARPVNVKVNGANAPSFRKQKAVQDQANLVDDFRKQEQRSFAASVEAGFRPSMPVVSKWDLNLKNNAYYATPCAATAGLNSDFAATTMTYLRETPTNGLTDRYDATEMSVTDFNPETASAMGCLSPRIYEPVGMKPTDFPAGSESGTKLNATAPGFLKSGPSLDACSAPWSSPPHAKSPISSRQQFHVSPAPYSRSSPVRTSPSYHRPGFNPRFSSPIFRIKPDVHARTTTPVRSVNFQQSYAGLSPHPPLQYMMPPTCFTGVAHPQQEIREVPSSSKRFSDYTTGGATNDDGELASDDTLVASPIASDPPLPEMRPRHFVKSSIQRNPDSDEEWSTLPQKKARMSKPSVVKSIRTTGQFRIPGVTLPTKRTGMSANSDKRVIKFLPPPLKIMSKSPNTGAIHGRRQAPRCMTGQGSSATNSEPISPRTSDTYNDAESDVCIQVNANDIARRYPQTKTLKYKRRCNYESFWDLLGLPSCGYVFLDANDQLDDELKIVAWDPQAAITPRTRSQSHENP